MGVWLGGRSSCPSTQRRVVQAITLIRLMWYTWYYPLPSRGVGLISPHRKPIFSFRKKRTLYFKILNGFGLAPLSIERDINIGPY